MEDATVVVVGAGPTGLAAARLLTQRGVPCVVLDRWTGVYPQPRAVHLDDEVYRVLGWMGLAGRFARISRPGLGLRLLDRDLRVLAEFPRGPGVHGFPEANMFDQPDLEHLLRDGLPVRGGVEVTGIDQDETGVEVHFTDLSTDTPDSIRANWVLGCDGANSVIRTSIGATMTDLGFHQRWLVVDAETDHDLGRWDGVHQVCDHTRPATYMRVGPRRHRWEFRLNPHDPLPDRHALLRHWTPHPLTIIRVAEYTFRAQIADRWRDRRVLLLGDAAHLTPPFIGQGLGAGIRDAANLAWKLAAVVDGTLPESALDTYQSERAPHTRSLIRLAVLIGHAMTGGGAKASALRRALLPRLRLLPLALNSRTPPLRRSTLIDRPRLLPTLAGTLCPNAPLPNGTRFDTAAAGRWAVISSTTPSPTVRATIARRGAVLIVTRPRDALHAWLRRGRAAAVLVRPDGTVARATSRFCNSSSTTASDRVIPFEGSDGNATAGESHC